MTPEELLNQLDSTNPLYKGANYEALRDYIMSLKECVEKQVPKKPIQRWTGDETVIQCPDCKCPIDITEAEWARLHCSHCGQAIDWGDSNEV